MPLTACPDCRHVSRVPFEQLGHRTRCPNCAQAFRATRMPFSFRRALRPGHAGGAALATLLLVAGLSLDGWTALHWTGDELTGSTWHLVLDGGVVATIAGVILLVRHVSAVDHRPQPVPANRRITGLGTPGLEPGTKRL